jgi:CheY-like chemotaxis protein
VTATSDALSVLVGGSILLVDDDALVLTAFRKRIEDAGCVCYTAATHNEALATLSSTPDITLVVLDYRMNGEPPDGFLSTLHHLRPGLPVIGHSAGDHERDFRDLGVMAYLQKPWTALDLTEALEANAMFKKGVDS